MERPKAIGTSHLAKFSRYLEGFGSCSSYPGLTVMCDFFDRNSLQKWPKQGNAAQERYKQKKTRQFEEFLLELSRLGVPEALLVLLSNDYKTFITDHKGHMLVLNKSARKKWNKLVPDEKCNYDVYEEKALKKPAKDHINKQFLRYEEILKNILKKSSLEVIHHSSILERINPAIPYLPLYFAILNSVLKKHLENWTKNETFKNKHGKPISCRFINVSKPFFSRTDPSSIFIAREVFKQKELTHRTDKVLDEIAAIWRSEV